VVGVVTAVLAERVVKDWPVAVATGWVLGAGVMLAWTWLIIGRMSSAQTRAHATAEDSTHAVTDLVLLGASLASLLGVGMLLLGNSQQGPSKVVDSLTGVLVVAAAWLLVHTMFTLRYAALYYVGAPGGIDFNQKLDPTYRDFAYLSFTIGMTYQVSDTNLQTPQVRGTALRQGLLAYLFGTVVVATTINLVVQLASAGRGL